MNTAQFLNRLRDNGIQLWMDAEKLRFRAPNGSLTEEMKAELARRKPDIMALLRQRESVGEPRIEPVARNTPIPLTYAQQRLWFLDQFQPGVPAYNVCDADILDRDIDLPTLRRAATELVRRHELLRTTFPAVDGVPIQRIAPPAPFPIAYTDLSELPEEQREHEAYRLADEEGRRSFDLAEGPLLRLGLLRLGPKRFMWLLSIHHIVSDDWSKKLLGKELEVLYDAFLHGRPSPLPELAIQWADFAMWQHRWLSGSQLDAHVDYWKQVLGGELPTLDLPFDRPRKTTVRGEKGKFFLPPRITRALYRLCETEGVTLFMAALAAYASLLAHYTRQDDIIIGSPISDRSKVETEGLIGFMLNTLPLRVRVDRNLTFRDLLRQVRETCLAAYNFQAVPYESLMQHLSIERDGTGNPLFRTVLTLLNTPRVERADEGLWGRDEQPFDISGFAGDTGPHETVAGNGTAMFDVSITLTEKHGGIWGKTEHNADMLDEASVAGLVERFQLLLRSAAEDPGRRIGDLSLQTATQRADMLQHFCSGKTRTQTVECLHQFVERHAREQPDAVAIEHEGTLLGYGELNARANRLARHLQLLGVMPEQSVGIYFERCIDQFVAVLAVLKTGAGYVPLDIAHPPERIGFILHDAHADVVVTTSSLATRFTPGSHTLLLVDRDAAAIDGHAAENLPLAGGSNGLACILYTSGSTGAPKGVALAHDAQINYAQDSAEAYRMGNAERVLQFASISFDGSLEETWLAFSQGGTLVLRSEGMLDSIDGFVAQCRALRLTLLVLPTVYWHEMVTGLDRLSLPPDLRCVIIGGERALPEKVARWQGNVAGKIALFNTYGPTEGTISVTRYEVPAAAVTSLAGAEVPIGPPNANTTVYVLDPYMEPLPWGVPGELFIGGVAVSRGYVGKPDLTAAAFVPDPFSTTPGARLYRTGDLARFMPDGNVQYQGRIDTQVKIRGYRIEPREVELALQKHPEVEDVVVTVREDEPGDRRLVAYLVAPVGHEPDPAALRSFLQSMLPSWMVPTAFISMPVLPVNTSGKVDIRALPAPGAGNVMTSSEYVAPRNATEERLCDIWKHVLKLDRIGIHENFFDLGGHSLLATRVVARINDALHMDLPLRRLFEAPTIADLAKAIGGMQPTVETGRTRVNSLGSLLETIDVAVPGTPGAVLEADVERMLGGLEHMTDAEIEALIAETNDPGLDSPL
jgi:amino acid adenylation domain-containing protein